MPKKHKEASEEYCGRSIRCSVYGCNRNIRYRPLYRYNNIHCTSCNKSGLNGTVAYINVYYEKLEK